MPIAPRMRLLTQQLELVRQRQRLGKTQLAELQKLNQEVTALLQEASHTHFENSLRCIQGLVRSLETLADQKERLASMAASVKVVTTTKTCQAVA